MPDRPEQAAVGCTPWRLHRILALYVLGVLGFLLLMAWAENTGLSRQWIGLCAPQ